MAATSQNAAKGGQVTVASSTDSTKTAAILSSTSDQDPCVQAIERLLAEVRRVAELELQALELRKQNLKREEYAFEVWAKENIAKMSLDCNTQPTRSSDTPSPSDPTQQTDNDKGQASKVKPAQQSEDKNHTESGVDRSKVVAGKFAWDQYETQSLERSSEEEVYRRREAKMRRIEYMNQEYAVLRKLHFYGCPYGCCHCF